MAEDDGATDEFDVADVDGFVEHVEAADVNHNFGGQIAWQGAYAQARDIVENSVATHNQRRYTLHVHGHIDFDRLAHVDGVEVDVNDGTADGVALEAVDKGGNGFFTGDVEGNQRRFAGSLHDWSKSASIGLYGDGGQVLAVYGSGQYTGFAQIVDLFAGHGALGQIEFDSHVDNSSCVSTFACAATGQPRHEDSFYHKLAPIGNVG